MVVEGGTLPPPKRRRCGRNAVLLPVCCKLQVAQSVVVAEVVESCYCCHIKFTLSIHTAPGGLNSIQILNIKKNVLYFLRVQLLLQ